MKKILLLLLVQSICHANIYDGNTDAIASPRDLSLNPMDIGQQDASQTTSVKNYILTNLSGQDRLRTFTTTSLMVLENSILELDGTFTFTHGSIKVVGNCAINGSSDFNKFRFESHLIFIENNSELRIGPGVNFEYAPTCSADRGIRFGNAASKLTLEDATLTVSNRQGLNFIKGQFRIEGNSTIDNFFTENNVQYLDRVTSYTEAALFLGYGPTSYGDCKLNITSGAKLTVKNAGIVYRNNGGGGFSGSNGKGTMVIDKNGSFIVDTEVDMAVGGVKFDYSKMSSEITTGPLTSIPSTRATSYELPGSTTVYNNSFSPSSKFIGYSSTLGIRVLAFNGSSLTELPNAVSTANGPYSIDWTPDEKYIAVGGTTDNNELEVRSFDGTSLAILSSAIYNYGGGSAVVNAIDWSPCSKYLATGSSVPSDGNELKVFSFNGTALTLLTNANLNFGTDLRGCHWSYDGKYIAYGGNTPDNGNEVQIYAFNNDAITSVANLDIGTPTMGNVRWSKDGRYLALAYIDGAQSYRVSIYRFDGIGVDTPLVLLTDTTVESSETIVPIRWSQNGKYVFFGGKVSGTTYEFLTYKFDGTSLTLVSNAILDLGVSASLYLWGISVSTDSKFVSLSGREFSFAENLNIYNIGYTPDQSKKAQFKNTTIKLNKDLTLRDINLKLK